LRVSDVTACGHVRKPFHTNGLELAGIRLIDNRCVILVLKKDEPEAERRMLSLLYDLHVCPAEDPGYE
jgi:hypothetical protein